MLTVRGAFGGDDSSDTLANVLKMEPDWTVLPADVSPAVRTLLRLMSAAAATARADGARRARRTANALCVWSAVAATPATCQRGISCTASVEPFAR